MTTQNAITKLQNLYKVETYNYDRRRWDFVVRYNEQAKAEAEVTKLTIQGYKARWIIRN